jgi:hypothetical protein
MTPIYSQLISAMQSRLADCDTIKDVYAYPVETVTKYPAAIFFPDSLENAFGSNQDNFKTYRFKLYVTVGTPQKEQVDIFSTVLPEAVDEVLAVFDQDWNVGTIDGHRVWVVISTGSWTMGVTPSGLEANAEFTVDFRLLTSV